jgi:hypothetical protein
MEFHRPWRFFLKQKMHQWTYAPPLPSFHFAEIFIFGQWVFSTSVESLFWLQEYIACD